MFTATFLLLLLGLQLGVCRCDTATTAHNADLSSAAVKDVPLTAAGLDSPTPTSVLNTSLAGMALEVLGDEASDENMVPWEAELDIFVRNADPNQPLLQAMDGAMPKEEFDALQDCLRDHPMRNHNVNSGDTFAGTTGFLLSFTEKGEQRFRDNAEFNCLESYFDRYKVTGSNGWVLNMVWAEVTDYTRELAIKLHTDDSLRLKRHLVGETKIMPVQTNVLYVFVPEDMVGGSLEAWNYNTGQREMKKGPQAYVQPIENRMAFFRGDALHQVRSYNTSSDSVLRGSLVLEQYKVPEEHLDVVIDFMWMERHGGEMM